MMKTIVKFNNKLDQMFPDARCELIYNHDYELLIATVLSAQCTDKRVNKVTKELFTKYDIFSLAKADISDIEEIIRSCGTYTRKALYIVNIAQELVKYYEGHVPNDRKFLESLSGVGRKTANVVLSNLYDVPAIAVDTHVARVSKRLGIAKEKDDVLIIEKKLMKLVPKELWSRTHHQMVLLGRYICKAKNPECQKCSFYEDCMSKDKRVY